MKKTSVKSKEKSPTIDEIGITSDTLSSRGGLSLLVRYLRNMCIAPRLESLFRSMRKNKKGQPVTGIFKLLLCYLFITLSIRFSNFVVAKHRDVSAAP